jgi:hypothetical protein
MEQTGEQSCLPVCYFSIRTRVSTAVILLLEPINGLISISTISGAAVTSAEIR